MPYVVAIENVTKQFRGKRVLDNFSLEVISGAITGLVGGRGTGKTVALLCMLGLMRVNEGQISWRTDRKDVGALVGAPAFHRELSIRGNLETQASLLPARDDGYVGRIDYLMSRLQITSASVGDRAARHLLIGQKQRLAIAMALLGEPELLVLDEPNPSLDNHEVKIFSELLREEGYGTRKSALITASAAEELDGIASKVSYLREGRNASF
ncbi:MAG: ATP-binding cassette domain-containing protein [Oscillospiraceae bacterium]|jgi:ABC-2 type transport system ATP-binding protein|nr:ATP-binding cassette domain-containing protein [Oscillospiraceae bacterium]